MQATGRLLGGDTHPVGARQLVELDRFTRIGHKGRHDGGCGVDKRCGAACPQGREYRTNGPSAIGGACEDMVVSSALASRCAVARGRPVASHNSVSDRGFSPMVTRISIARSNTLIPLVVAGGVIFCPIV